MSDALTYRNVVQQDMIDVPTTFRVLLLEGDATCPAHLSELVTRSGIPYRKIPRTTRLEQILVTCLHQRDEVLLIDATAGDAVHLVKQIRMHAPTLPIVAAAAQGERGAATDVIRQAGADAVYWSETGGNLLAETIRAAAMRRMRAAERNEPVKKESGGEAFYRRTLNSMPNMVAILDAGGTIQFVNKAWRSLVENHPTGILCGMVGANYFELCSQVNDDSAGQAQEFVEGMQNVAHGELSSFCLKIKHPASLSWKWTASRVIPLHRNGAGRIMVSHSNISLRMPEMDEAGRRETDSLLQYINSPDPMWICDSKTLVFLSVNEAALRTLGYAREEFLSITLNDIAPNGGAHAITGCKATRTNLVCKDKTLIRADVSSQNVPYEGVEAIFFAAQNVTRTQQGTMQSEGDLGKGATFSLHTPAAVRQHQATARTSAGRGSELSARETILVVEDDDTLRGLLASLLEHHGYRVLSAQDGQDAIDIFKAYTNEIDMVFTDLGLPHQNGLEVFLKLKSIKPDMKIILCSAYLEPDTRASLLRAGVKMVIQKPFDGARVAWAIRRVLDGAPQHELLAV
jgi:DNA-binding response OmpR family regulator